MKRHFLKPPQHFYSNKIESWLVVLLQVYFQLRHYATALVSVCVTGICELGNKNRNTYLCMYEFMYVWLNKKLKTISKLFVSLISTNSLNRTELQEQFNFKVVHKRHLEVAVLRCIQDLSQPNILPIFWHIIALKVRQDYPTAQRNATQNLFKKTNKTISTEWRTEMQSTLFTT